MQASRRRSFTCPGSLIVSNTGRPEQCSFAFFFRHFAPICVPARPPGMVDMYAVRNVWTIFPPSRRIWPGRPQKPAVRQAFPERSRATPAAGSANPNVCRSLRQAAIAHSKFKDRDHLPRLPAGHLILSPPPTEPASETSKPGDFNDRAEWTTGGVICGRVTRKARLESARRSRNSQPATGLQPAVYCLRSTACGLRRISSGKLSTANSPASSYALRSRALAASTSSSNRPR